MILLVKLILAHLIGDFLLQPKSWVKTKEKKGLRSVQLYLHAGLHAALTFLFVWDILPAIIIGTSHLIIDAVKLSFQKAKKTEWFFIDQLLHLLVILAVGCYYENYLEDFNTWMTSERWIYITAVVALTFPASLGIKNCISKWQPATENAGSLENAGMYIGMLERLLILLFLVTDHWEAIGFLLAAKSVFRFGDLRESRDKKLTEYVLVGTLLSFGSALLVGLTALYILHNE